MGDIIRFDLDGVSDFEYSGAVLTLLGVGVCAVQVG
jgi:hypothetical protein